MSDPLTLLRELTITGGKAHLEDDNLLIGEYQTPKDALTNFKKVGTKGYYTIEAIWFLLENSKMIHPQYIRDAKAKKIPKVTLADRKDILGYVTGEIATTTKINATAISGTAVLRSKTAEKRKSDDAQSSTTQPDSKRSRIDQEIVTRDLSKDITKDKISELRAKRDRAKRQEQTIHSRQESSNRFAREIVEREQLIRSRTTVMLSKGKKFTEVLGILTKIQEDEARKEKEAKEAKRRQQQSSAYNRYDINPNAYYSKKNKGIEEFGIDIYGGAGGEEKEQPRPAPQKTEQPAQKSRKPSKPPIIIVPNGKMSVINLQNVKFFLEGSRYMTSPDAKEHCRNIQCRIDPQKGVTVNHIRNDASTGGRDVAQKYVVLDSVQRLKKEDWPRVVAVFVQGPEWQFKGWPYDHPARIFAAVRGFYVRMEDVMAAPHENIKKWNVNTLTLNSRSRHLDQIAVLQFWRQLNNPAAK